MGEHYPTTHHRLPNKIPVPRMSYIFYIGYRGPPDVPITHYCQGYWLPSRT